MVWSSFGWNNKSDLLFIDGNIDFAGYTKTLEDNLITHALHLPNDNYIFQQDNTPIHLSKVTKQ